MHVPLFLTYDNKTLQDGIGAQALRILGVFSIANFFRFRYLHNPILEVIEEFAHKFESTTSNRVLLEQANDFFSFPSSSINPRLPTKVYRLENPSLRVIVEYVFRFEWVRSNIVLEILFPFFILNKFPSIYYFGVRRLRKRNKLLMHKSPTPQVVAHVRWGYGWKYANQQYVRNRHLPFSYFSKLFPIIKANYFQSKQLNITVHTDLSPNKVNWKPIQSQVLEQRAQVRQTESENEIEIEGYDLEKLITFPDDCNHNIRYCAPFFETFLDMCRAEILIMGTSAFSYLAGLLNKNIVIWPSVHGHSRFPTWKSSASLGLAVQREEMLRG